MGWSIWAGPGDKRDGGQTERPVFIDSLYAAYGIESAGAPSITRPEQQIVDAFAPTDELLVEDWRIYPWEAKNLSWDRCNTARLIGQIHMAARLTDRPLTFQRPDIKKAAENAGADNFFVSPRYPNRHENDSILHAVYFYTVGEGKGRE